MSSLVCSLVVCRLVQSYKFLIEWQGIMRNKKGGARFSESTAHAGCPFIRSYGRV